MKNFDIIEFLNEMVCETQLTQKEQEKLKGNTFFLAQELNDEYNILFNDKNMFFLSENTNIDEDLTLKLDLKNNKEGVRLGILTIAETHDKKILLINNNNILELPFCYQQDFYGAYNAEELLKKTLTRYKPNSKINIDFTYDKLNKKHKTTTLINEGIECVKYQSFNIFSKDENLINQYFSFKINNLENDIKFENNENIMFLSINETQKYQCHKFLKNWLDNL